MAKQTILVKRSGKRHATTTTFIPGPSAALPSNSLHLPSTATLRPTVQRTIDVSTPLPSSDFDYQDPLEFSEFGDEDAFDTLGGVDVEFHHQLCQPAKRVRVSSHLSVYCQSVLTISFAAISI